LGDDDTSCRIVYSTTEEDDALTKEARVDIVSTLSELTLLYNCWDKI